MLEDPATLTKLLELLQGGGTAGVLVAGYIMLRRFEALRELIQQGQDKSNREMSKLRERLVRIEVELEHISARTGGNFEARQDDEDP